MFIRQLEPLFCTACQHKNCGNLCCNRQAGKLRPTVCGGVCMCYPQIRTSAMQTWRAWETCMKKIYSLTAAFFIQWKGLKITLPVHMRRWFPKSFGVMGRMPLFCFFFHQRYWSVHSWWVFCQALSKLQCALHPVFGVGSGSFILAGTADSAP